MARGAVQGEARASLAAAMTVVLAALAGPSCYGQTRAAVNRAPSAAPTPVARAGAVLHTAGAFQGYTLVAPTNSTKTYLIDMAGEVVHTWQSDCFAGQSAYLLGNGHLLRAGRLNPPPPGFGPVVGGGRVQEFAWDGALVWDFKYAKPTQLPHHDLCKLPNGNVLLIVAEQKTAQEAAAAGRKEAGPLLADCLLEIQPTGKTTGKVVWEWHVWDHLIQDHDRAQANYGDVASHPERIDVNYGMAAIVRTPEDWAKLRSLGYVGAAPAGTKTRQSHLDWNWNHTNSVTYNAATDQIMLSVRGFSEVWIIAHDTTTAEAAGHWGHLLYRWGNPRAYRAAGKEAQQLFFQHDAHWIRSGCPGAGHLLVFNNGGLRPGGNYSSVDEIVLPVNDRGQYEHRAGVPFGPEKPAWSYTAPHKGDFFCVIMGGAQRLANGNTLVCSSTTGTIFEVTTSGEVVWKYINPPPSSVEFMLELLSTTGLHFSPDQARQLGMLEKQASTQLDKILDAAQKDRLKKGLRAFGPGGPGVIRGLLVRQVLPPFAQRRLEMTAGQQRLLADLQKQASERLDGILTPAQKEHLPKSLNALRGGGAGGLGTKLVSPAFRAYRYPADYPGLAGRHLTPRSPPAGSRKPD
jgi:hypothetical protein